MTTATARIHLKPADTSAALSYQIAVHSLLKASGQPLVAKTPSWPSGSLMTREELDAMVDAFYSDITPEQFAALVMQARA